MDLKGQCQSCLLCCPDWLARGGPPAAYCFYKLPVLNLSLKVIGNNDGMRSTWKLYKKTCKKVAAQAAAVKLNGHHPTKRLGWLIGRFGKFILDWLQFKPSICLRLLFSETISVIMRRVSIEYYCFWFLEHKCQKTIEWAPLCRIWIWRARGRQF